MGLLSFFFGSCTNDTTNLDASNRTNCKFRAGQVWAVKSLANQPDAKLTVLRVDDGGKLGPIVHVSLFNVSYGRGQTTIQHLPFAESSVERSVGNLEGESTSIPDLNDGYRVWREAFDAGKAGVFTITVAQAYDAVTGVVRKHE